MWELDYKESWAPKNWCFWTVGRDSWESLTTARVSNQSILKEISPEYSWKVWCWSWNFNTLTTWCEEPTHWKRPWCWEILKVGGEGDDRGLDGWMASPMWWTWVWIGSGSGDGQGSLASCSRWGRKESDMTERLNWLGGKAQGYSRNCPSALIIPKKNVIVFCLPRVRGTIQGEGKTAFLTRLSLIRFLHNHCCNSGHLQFNALPPGSSIL